MKRSVKFLIFVVVLAVVVAAVLISRQRSIRDEIEVVAEALERRDLAAVVEASGQIEPAVSVDISSDVIGRIIELGAEEGDRVERGQFLIQIDPTQFEQRVARLEAEVDASRSSLSESEASLLDAEANLAISRADFDRDQALYQQRLVPESRYQATEAAWQRAQAQVELARSRVESARNRIRQAQASLAEARDQLGRCRITSPMAGVVIRRNADVGETAISGTLNNQGSLLMTIADLSVMETEVDVDETDVIHVELGQEVEISLDAFPSRKFKGAVTRIGNSAIQSGATTPGSRQSADYKVEITLQETDPKIRPGLSATARITTSRREQALAVPIQALVVREAGEIEEKPESEAAPAAAGAEGGEAGGGVALAATRGEDDTGEQPAADAGADDEGGEEDRDKKDREEEEVEGVFVVRDGKAVFVKVETGIAGEQYFEVLSGLSEGDQVVSGNFAALRRLKNGDPVKVSEDEDDEDD